jgi:hypothetical protein
MVKRSYIPLPLTPEDRAQLEMWRDAEGLCEQFFSYKSVEV